MYTSISICSPESKSQAKEKRNVLTYRFLYCPLLRIKRISRRKDFFTMGKFLAVACI